jgi:rhamnose transport system permease protein
MRGREYSLVWAIGALLGVLVVATPAYFSADNLRDLFLANVPVLIIALGATLVILTGHIDVSVGSSFAVCGIVAGVLANAGVPMWIAALGAVSTGAVLGAMNGALVAYAGIPAIVVTLATMIAWRDALRWVTQGTWVHGLPSTFQWLGLPLTWFPFVVAALVAVLVTAAIVTTRHMAWGRFVYAVGSNREAARLIGLRATSLVFVVFVIAGALTGAAAVLNAVRFNQIPANAGLGLELKVIAAVIVGGTAIQGGRGTIAGTALGVLLLGLIGPALTFLGVSAYWERAIQGAIILAAVAADAVRGHLTPTSTLARPPAAT